MEYPSTRSVRQITARRHSPPHPSACSDMVHLHQHLDLRDHFRNGCSMGPGRLRLRLHLVGGLVVRATFGLAPASSPVLDDAILHTLCALKDPASLLVERLAGKCAIKTCLRVELECGTTPAGRRHVEFDARGIFKIRAARRRDKPICEKCQACFVNEFWHAGSLRTSMTTSMKSEGDFAESFKQCSSKKSGSQVKFDLDVQVESDPLPADSQMYWLESAESCKLDSWTD